MSRARLLNALKYTDLNRLLAKRLYHIAHMQQNVSIIIKKVKKSGEKIARAIKSKQFKLIVDINDVPLYRNFLSFHSVFKQVLPSYLQ